MRLALLAFVEEPQIVERHLGLVGDLAQESTLEVGVESVLVVQIPGLAAGVALELTHRVTQAPAQRLLGDDLRARDDLEHAIDQAPLEIADGRADARQPLAARATPELHEDALLVEFDLELAELHLPEPLPEPLQRVDLAARG